MPGLVKQLAKAGGWFTCGAFTTGITTFVAVNGVDAVDKLIEADYNWAVETIVVSTALCMGGGLTLCFGASAAFYLLKCCQALGADRYLTENSQERSPIQSV